MVSNDTIKDTTQLPQSPDHQGVSHGKRRTYREAPGHPTAKAVQAYLAPMGKMRQRLTGAMAAFAGALTLVSCDEGTLSNRLADYAGTDQEPCVDPPQGTVIDQTTSAQLTDSTATWAYVLEEGEEAVFTRAWLSEHAGKTIDIQYFIFSMDNIGIIALDYLLRAADRGVQVRMLVDDIMLDVALDDVRALNAHPHIDIRVYNPTPGKNVVAKASAAVRDFQGFNQRMHNKTFIVDGAVAMTGGRNIADEYFDYDQAYNFRDRDVMLVGAGARAVGQSFETFWADPLAVTLGEAPEDVNTEELYQKIQAYACDEENFWPEIRALIDGIPDAIPAIIASGRLHRIHDFQFISDAPGKNDSDTFHGGGLTTSALTACVAAARESVMIQSPYLILTPDGLQLFANAVARGVEVTILTNSLCSTDNLEAFNGYQRIRQQLLCAGVRVFEYRPDAAIRRQLITAEKQKRTGYEPVFGLHAKSMVVDHAQVVIGTFNLDPRSANLNTECAAIMTSEAMAAQVESLMTEELLPANAWQTTARWNPDAEAGVWKRFQCWLRGLVPSSIL
jgi:phosphatidylserine/phosphatidylglycerophosphate/cardiolipin synthase-like enzyme